MPLIDSAPIVVPWYAVRREIAFQRRSPRAPWYWRASFQADSTASEPPETKKTRLRSPGASVCELGGELDRARVRVRPVGVERQLLHLLVRGSADLVAVRVAELNREQARERVQVALAVRVLEVAALAADDDRHLGVPVAAHAGEVEPQVVARLLLEPCCDVVLGEGHGETLQPRLDVRAHVGSSSTRTSPEATAGSTVSKAWPREETVALACEAPDDHQDGTEQEEAVADRERRRDAEDLLAGVRRVRCPRAIASPRRRGSRAGRRRRPGRCR